MPWGFGGPDFAIQLSSKLALMPCSIANMVALDRFF
jgi:hypothetical protein